MSTAVATARLLVWAAVVVAVKAQAETASFTITVLTNRGVARAASDPCQQHRCPDGQQCVVHEVRCRRGPCPRIGECQPVDCAIRCPPESQCHQPADGPPRCQPRRQRCGGKCLPDEQCVEVVQPCLSPPCLQQQLCIGSGRVTARRLPPVCPVEAVCPEGFQCVMTKACRRPGDCSFQMSCLPPPPQPDCTTHWCEPGQLCRMQEVQCTDPPCGVLPECYEPEPPQCDPACSDTEECTLVGLPLEPRCTPRLPELSSRFGSPFASRAGRSGVCPVNDLKDLASKAFCDDARLDRCQADRDCDRGRRCCERGCGNACLPVCPLACASGEECKLVTVQCLGKPCPKVAQCVAAQPQDPPLSADDEELLDTLLGESQSSASGSASASASQENRPAPLPSATTTASPRPASTSAPSDTGINFPEINFGPFGPGGEPIGPGFTLDSEDSLQQCDGGPCGEGERCRTIPCDNASLCPRVCQAVSPNKPGSCPANEQPPSVICFQDRFRDLCFDDADCAGDARCCLNGCARQCRPVCADPGCPAGKQCRLLPGRRVPRCVQLPVGRYAPIFG